MKDDLSPLIKRAHITEKASAVLANNQYVFLIKLDASKDQVKNAIEAFYKVKVAAVKTCITSGKTKRYGRFTGKRSDSKKAYVSLMEGYTINTTDNERVKE